MKEASLDLTNGESELPKNERALVVWLAQVCCARFTTSKYTSYSFCKNARDLKLWSIYICKVSLSLTCDLQGGKFSVFLTCDPKGIAAEWLLGLGIKFLPKWKHWITSLNSLSVGYHTWHFCNDFGTKFIYLITPEKNKANLKVKRPLWQQTIG